MKPTVRLAVALAASVLVLGMPALAQEGAASAEALRAEAFTLVSGTAADKTRAIGLFEQAAAAGDAASMAFLGGLYLAGDGVAADRDMAISWYLKAAQAGHTGAAAKLAELAAGGAEPAPAISPDPAPAVESAPMAEPVVAAPAALDELQQAIALWDQSDPRRDYDAVKVFQQLSDAGDPEAMTYLGDAYAGGQGVTQDAAMAMQLYEQALAAGYAPARNGIARLYWNGNGVEQDRDHAIALYDEGAAAGDTDASSFLTSVYMYALNGTRDIDKALEYAAVGGGPETLARIGNIHQLILDDTATAIDFYEQGVAAGDTDAYGDLGDALYFETMSGDESTLSRAIGAMEQGVAHDDPFAMSSLARLYVGGVMIEPDLAKGIALMEQAVAVSGDPYFMINLAQLYDDGFEVDRDPEQAAKWYRLAIWAGENGYWEEYAALQDSRDIVVPPATMPYERTPADVRLADALATQARINSDNDDAASLANSVEDYTHAALLGSAEAMDALGVLYWRGEAVAQDQEVAVQWFRRGADLGSVPAMLHLSQALADAEIATLWARRAASGDDAVAWVAYGNRLIAGIGVEADPAAGIDLLRRAEAEAEPTAFTALGRAFADGAGVDLNNQLAGQYLYAGLVQGDVDSLLALSEGGNDAYAAPVRQELQRQLQQGGFYDDTIDGDLGPGTRAAMQAAFGTAEP